MARQLRRNHRRRPIRTVPGRLWPGHRQRHPDPAVLLLGRQQPEVVPQLIRDEVPMYRARIGKGRRALMAALVMVAAAAVALAVTLVADPARADVTGALRGVGSGRCLD